MTISAPIAPANTKKRLWRIAITAAIQNVLSPSSVAMIIVTELKNADPKPFAAATSAQRSPAACDPRLSSNACQSCDQNAPASRTFGALEPASAAGAALFGASTAGTTTAGWLGASAAKTQAHPTARARSRRATAISSRGDNTGITVRSNTLRPYGETIDAAEGASVKGAAEFDSLRTT